MPGPPVDPAASICIDAYTGTDAVSGTFAGDVKPWALTRPSYGEKTQRPGETNEACWSSASRPGSRRNSSPQPPARRHRSRPLWRPLAAR